MYLWPGKSVACRVQLLVDGHAPHIIDRSVGTSSGTWSIGCCPPTRTGAHIGSCLIVHIPVCVCVCGGGGGGGGRKNGVWDEEWGERKR